ncbi:MAG: flavodoxin [Campylobacterales bacterium]|nr:flavodoxin [Campylobacterales bacterium]
MNTAIFYGSTVGNTQSVALKISKQLGDVPIFDIDREGIGSMYDFEKIIIGSSTWHNGELSNSWQKVWHQFYQLDFVGKTVALFGLGNQEKYDENYVDAMGIIYKKVLENKANVVGQWQIDNNYNHLNSKAEVDGNFIGLALDEDNQRELTDSRIEKWCNQIKQYIL